MAYKYETPIETLELSDQPNLDSPMTTRRFENTVSREGEIIV